MRWSALAFLLFAFAAGGAFGYLFGAGGHGNDAGDTLGSLDHDGGRRPAPAAPDRADLLPSPGRGGALSRALADVPVERAPTGTGTISGTVLAEDGRPLSGVLVRAQPQPNRGRRTWVRGGGLPEDKDLETALREYAASYRLRIASQRDAMTDAEGRYAVTGLSDDPCYLSAWLEGYEIRQATPSQTPPRAGDTVDFTAKALGTIPLDVLMPDGSPAESATIQCVQSSQTLSMPWDRKTGYIRLDPAAWRLTAAGGEDDAFRSEEVAVVVDPGATVEPITMNLADHPGIRGRIRFEEPDETAQGMVVAMRLAPGESPDPARLERANANNWFHGRTEMKFALHDLEPGTWFVGARLYNDNRLIASATVEVADRMVELDLLVPAPAPEEYFTVVLEAPDGSPVSDAQVSTDCAESGRPIGQGLRSNRRPDGTYRVFHPNVPEGAPEASRTYRLHAHASRFGTKTVEYVPGRDARVVLRFEEPAFLEVAVTGLDAPGAPGSVSVSLQPADTGSRPRSSPWVDGASTPVKGGKAALGPVAPGTYRLRLTAGDNRFGGSGLAEFTLDLGPGQSHETIAIPALYSLTVIVPESEASPVAYLSIRPRNRDSGTTYSRSDRPEGGKVVFDRVPAGEYQLRGGGRGGGVMDVTVPGSAVVTFAPRPVNALAVRITDPAGPMAKAGLREGDVIVAIDGTEFETEAQMSALQTLARDKESVKLGVIRGNGRIQIALDFGKIRSSRESGGYFESVAR